MREEESVSMWRRRAVSDADEDPAEVRRHSDEPCASPKGGGAVTTISVPIGIFSSPQPAAVRQPATWTEGRGRSGAGHRRPGAGCGDEADEGDASTQAAGADDEDPWQQREGCIVHSLVGKGGQLPDSCTQLGAG